MKSADEWWDFRLSRSHSDFIEAIRELLAKERVKIEDLRAMDERVQHYMELWRKSKNGGAE